MDNSKIINLEKIIIERRAKIKHAQRQLYNLNAQQHTKRLIIAGRVLEDAGLLEKFNYDATLQVLLTHKEECLCKSQKH